MTTTGRQLPDPVDVCLVSMPYVSLSRPSMALGLLKSILEQDGLRTAAVHANIWFAEQAGLESYELCASQTPTFFLAGEWTFAGAAFPDADTRAKDEEYLRELAVASRAAQLYKGARGEKLIPQLRALRAAATTFVNDAAERVLATGARVVGCTSTFEQHVPSLALLRRVKELDPAVITLMGGANCETAMGAATHRCFDWVDYVVSGEADGLITKLCRIALTSGRAAEAADLPPGVLGPCHRDEEAGRSGTRARLPRALFRDLDSLPTPRYEDYFATLEASPLRLQVRPGIPVETSRGCWWGDSHQCTFCGLNGSSLGFRSKSADRVLAELTELEERYGLSDFEAVDNILDMEYFRNLLPKLAADGKRRHIFYEVKANLSRAHIQSLVNAGILWAQPGIESLHSEVLHLMDKGVRGWQNVQLLKWARENGLRLSWALLWGFPGEKDEYYKEMAAWMPSLEHLQPPQNLTRLRYDRYSVYHDQASRMGLMLFPIGAMSYVYPVPSADLADLTYFFSNELSAGPARYINGLVEDIAARPGIQATSSAMKVWARAFNRSPAPVLAMQDRDGVLDVVDSRPSTPSQRLTLTGAARAVCLACDAAPRPAKLRQIVRKDHGLDVTDDEISRITDDLISDRLVLPIDDRLVGLAIRGNVPPLPSIEDFPGGHVFLS